MERFIIILLLSFSGPALLAQESIDADRPDQTESAVLTPTGLFQAEFGFSLEKDDGLKSFAHPTALWKYGISNRFEVRLITEFISQEIATTFPQGKKTTSSILPIQIGTRVALWEEKGLLPKTSFLFHVGIPAFSSSAFKPPHAATTFRLSMAHSLSEKSGWGIILVRNGMGLILHQNGSIQLPPESVFVRHGMVILKPSDLLKKMNQPGII